jgi:hypothetical protein
MSRTLAAPAASDSAACPEELARDLLATSAWALAAAVRASQLITADVDAIALVNSALRQTEFRYRLVAEH